MEAAMRIAIVGGGATEILAGAHLARRLDAANDEVVVIEPGEALGRGLAYATNDPRHLLNVRIANMSAFADEPDLGLVGADGTVSRRIKAIGPLARAAFWECIAIPDIRLQCAALADALTKARAPSAPARGLEAPAGR